MKIVCPHCAFSREVPDGQVPDRPVKVTCPQCQQGFPFDKTALASAPPGAADLAAAPRPATAAMEEATTCPACGLVQPPADSCTGCGLIYAKWVARQEAAKPGTESPPRGDASAGPDIRIICNSCGAVQPPGHQCINCGAILPTTAARMLPHQYAGFWIRVVASIIDGLLLGAVQFAIGLVLNLAGGAADGFGSGGGFALFAITWLCSVVVSMTYYVFFTGYNGQTPGKMALRIQVIRTDGTPMSYGRAFLREVVGKFASGIILGIGYLMVAFDRNKQGLHDRIAGTYVIRL